jgi:hypothetical protein
MTKRKMTKRGWNPRMLMLVFSIAMARRPMSTLNFCFAMHALATCRTTCPRLTFSLYWYIISPCCFALLCFVLFCFCFVFFFVVTCLHRHPFVCPTVNVSPCSCCMLVSILQTGGLTNDRPVALAKGRALTHHQHQHGAATASPTGGAAAHKHQADCPLAEEEEDVVDEDEYDDEEEEDDYDEEDDDCDDPSHNHDAGPSSTAYSHSRATNPATPAATPPQNATTYDPYYYSGGAAASGNHSSNFCPCPDCDRDRRLRKQEKLRAQEQRQAARAAERERLRAEKGQATANMRYSTMFIIIQTIKSFAFRYIKELYSIKDVCDRCDHL